ncbi:bifunctional diguanylate cyclase/phosphodiesterase [Pelagibius sp. Alg239-R121]|uniref:putative bifunctional diguanylate cyclase/phosphodiesterase n=1 Tax=Pelagibius sp. Alg239-R121 TaxID=2993448 RepID=UPI0024A712EB|nr:EAL domain-containing protein [Pelagibius sp. Alg239-R121]
MTDLPPTLSDGPLPGATDQPLPSTSLLLANRRICVSAFIGISLVAMGIASLCSWLDHGKAVPDGRIFLIVWSAGLASGAVVLFLIQRAFLVPMARWTDAVERRDYTTAQVELGNLARHTPRRLERLLSVWGELARRSHEYQEIIDTTRKDLTDTADKFEAELSARTAELIDANEALQQKIVEHELAENQLRYDIFHDRLTALPNRSLFSDRLNHAIQRTQRRGEPGFAVLLFNIDRFKDVNDSLGLKAGDQLLVLVSQRIREALRPGDTLARLGGDDFGILIENVSDSDDATACARRVLALLEEPIEIEGRDVFCSGSIGIADSRVDYSRAESLLQDATCALETAKAKSRPNYVFFEPAMRSADIPRLEIETDLRRAVKSGDEFVLFYQPIMALNVHKVAGFEALIRWQHPTRGLVGPFDFISIAEDTGLIIQIGRWVLKEACAQLRRWRDEGVIDKKMFMSVNVSSRQLTDESLIDDVAHCLSAYDLDPSCIKLEVTESLLMEDPKAAVKILDELKTLQVQLSIDDFGTGYSSLSYLHKFPFDYLKIDQSFVFQMTQDVEIREIVRTIITLAHGLNMDVIAEGVEDAETAKGLLRLGCHLVQGYHYSRPIEAAKIIDFLAEIDKS